MATIRTKIPIAAATGRDQFVDSYMGEVKRENALHAKAMGEFMLRKVAPIGVAVLILGGTLYAANMIYQRYHAPAAEVQKVSGVGIRK